MSSRVALTINCVSGEQAGYGNLQVRNVAVLDRIETLTRQLRTVDAALAVEEQSVQTLSTELSKVQEAIDSAGPSIVADRVALDASKSPTARSDSPDKASLRCGNSDFPNASDKQNNYKKSWRKRRRG